MQTFVVPASDHQSACELVHDDDLIILDYIVHIPLHQTIGTDCLIDMVQQSHILGVHEVLYAKVPLCLGNTILGKGGTAGLFIDDVITVQYGVIILLGIHFRYTANLQALGKPVCQRIQL